MLSQHIHAIENFVAKNPSITLGNLLLLLGHDSVLLIISVLALFNIVLAPLPMNSVILGIPLFILASMYLLKADIARLPQKVLNKHFKCVAWRPYMPRVRQYTQRGESVIKPRWEWAFAIENRLCSGLSLVLLTLIIVLPIPFANIPASLGTLCLTLGMLQRDGLLYCAGHAIMLLHLLAVYVLKTTLIGLLSG
jgi:hypothetical protein